ncbi:MAG: hypothetical protein SynsKO_35360 [Synoicihabitans sp.]
MSEQDQLNQLLQKWQPQPSEQPDFARVVQQQIERKKAPVAGEILRFPAALPLAASLAIVAGTIAGLTVNDSRAEKLMADAYARSIDPVRMVSSSHP